MKTFDMGLILDEDLDRGVRGETPREGGRHTRSKADDRDLGCPTRMSGFGLEHPMTAMTAV
jgi:hypothetical protein